MSGTNIHRHINRRDLEEAKASCTTCGGAGWVRNVSDHTATRCQCLWRIQAFGLLGPELYNARPIDDGRLDLERSYLLYGSWQDVAGRIKYALVKALLSYQSPRRPRVITDRDVRRVSLPQAQDDQEKREDVYALMRHAGLLVLKLGFAPAKNAEVANYLFEAIDERGWERPLWIVVSRELSKLYTNNELLTAKLDSFSCVDLRHGEAA